MPFVLSGILRRDPGASESLVLTRPRLRAGAAVRSLLTLMCGAAILLTAAAVLDPATLQARSIIAPPDPRPLESHVEFTRSLAAIINQSHRVLAIERGENDEASEIVLWVDDRRDAGFLNADELAVIRHSPLFQTITVYRTSKNDREDARTASGGASADLLDPGNLRRHGALDRWRANPAVQARVICTGVRSMSLAPSPEAQGSPAGSAKSLSLLRLTLTWHDEQSDVRQSEAASGRASFMPHAARASDRAAGRAGSQTTATVLVRSQEYQP